MIERAEHRRGLQQDIQIIRVGGVRLANDLDALGGVERLVERFGAHQSPVQEQKVDVVIPAAAGLQRLRLALLGFQARAHPYQQCPQLLSMGELLPEHPLQPHEELLAGLRVARDSPGLHVRDGFP